MSGSRIIGDPKKTELEFRRLLEALPAGAYTCDAGGLITYYNARAVETWGRAPKLNDPVDRFCGSFRLFSSDGRPLRHDQCWMARALLENKGFNGQEIVVERPDGSRWTVLAHANPIYDDAGKLVGAVNVLVDITDRRRTEETCAASERQLRTVIETSPEPIMIIDRQLNLVAINPAGLDVCDAVVDDEIRGRSVLELIAPEDCDAFRDFNERICAGERGTLEFDIVGRRGNRRTLETHSAPLPEERGELRHLAVARDVTVQRKACIALRDADRRKDEFLAMLAHELRNPLAPVRNAAVLLGMENLDAASAADAREILLRQVEHLSRLVDDLLDVSRIMRGKVELRREKVELSEVIGRAVEASQPLLLQNGHEFSISLPKTPVWLRADSVRLAQVFSNLLNNAAKFTPPSGHIRLTGECEADGVAIHVSDDGVGIEPELLPHVFEMFVQGEKSVDRSQGGLGIGLTLVRTIVELHDGSVVVRSEGVGHGTEFVVRLPVVKPDRLGHAAERTVPSTRPLRILVVEDNVGAAKVLSRLLEKFWNHDVRTAHHGTAALEVADEFRPQLVLCDIGLPHMSGYDVAKRLRARPELRDSLLVALTGYGSVEDRRRSNEAGFDLHLVKPASVETLQRVFEHPKLATVDTQ